MSRFPSFLAVVSLFLLPSLIWPWPSLGADAQEASPLDRPSVERLFASLCAHHDDSYGMCRDLIVERGAEALPYLSEKARAGSPLEQLAAEDAIVRIRDAETVEKWRGGLWYQARLEFRDDGTVLSVVERAGARSEVVYGRKAVPFLVGEIWTSTSGPLRVEKLYRVLAHLGDERVVWPLALHAPAGDEKSAWQEALMRFGKVATPALRASLERELRGFSRGRHVAEVLGRIGDPSAAPELKEAIRRGSGGVAPKAAQALCRMKHPGAAETIWPVLMELADDTRERERPAHRRNLRYTELRDPLGELGEALVPFIRSKRAEAPDERTRAICDGILARFADPEAFAAFAAMIDAQRWIGKDEPYRIPQEGLDAVAVGFLLEEAHVLHNPRVVATLGVCRHPRAFEAIAANWPQGKGMGRFPDQLVVVEALGDLGDVRGIPMLTPVAADPGSAGERYQHDRRAAWSIFRIGGPEAAKALRDAGAKNEGIRTEVGLYADVLDGRLDEARRLLESDHEVPRTAAALALVSRGEVEALPVFLDHLASLRGLEYERLRPYLTALGTDKLEAIMGEVAHEDWRHRLPAESAVIELTRPDAFRGCREALRITAARIAPYHVHTYGMVDGGGRGVADKVTADNAALLEEVMYFMSEDRGGLVPAVAAAALGYLKQDRSLPVLAASARMPAYRGSSPVFEALKKFGEKGAKVAASLPPPDPGRPAFQSRRVRTVRAADMLAGLDRDASVEKLLEWHGAWKKATDEQRRQMHLGPFFDAARKVPDPRLLPVLLGVFPRAGSYYLEKAALALESYDDERVIPLLVDALPSGLNGNLSLQVLEALTRLAHGRTPALLAEAFDHSPPPRARVIAAAIVRLTKPEFYRGSQAPMGRLPGIYDTPEKIQAAAALAREVALPVVYKALEDPDSERAAAAAHGLTWMNTPDPETDRRIAAWVAAGGDIFWHNFTIANYLRERTPKGAEPGILASFRRNPSNDSLMRLVGVFQLEEAVPQLKDQLLAGTEKERSRWKYMRGSTAASVLASLGEPGLAALVEVAAGDTPFASRIYATDALAKAGDKAVFPGAKRLYRELDRAGTAHPALAPLGEQERSDLLRGWLDRLLGVFASAGGTEGERLLKQVSALHADEMVRRQAVWHLERLRRPG